jgi:hypothetical protein
MVNSTLLFLRVPALFKEFLNQWTIFQGKRMRCGLLPSDLGTLANIAGEKISTIVFLLPVDLLKLVGKRLGQD